MALSSGRVRWVRVIVALARVGVDPVFQLVGTPLRIDELRKWSRRSLSRRRRAAAHCCRRPSSCGSKKLVPSIFHPVVVLDPTIGLPPGRERSEFCFQIEKWSAALGYYRRSTFVRQVRIRDAGDAICFRVIRFESRDRSEVCHAVLYAR